MTRVDFCTEDEIVALVHRFYARVRRDTVLGPIFDTHIEDWDDHLEKLVDFWSAVLRGTGRYHGMPMPRHVALDHLSQDLFDRWLALFHETLCEIGNPELAGHAQAAAGRMARSFLYGWQAVRQAGIGAG